MTTVDLNQVQVLLVGLEAIYNPPPGPLASLPSSMVAPAVAELHQLGKTAYEKLWVPKAVLQPGSEFTLPDGIAVKVTKIVWNSAAHLHTAQHTATLHVEKA